MSGPSTPKHPPLEHHFGCLTREDLRSELQAFALQVLGPQLSELAARVERDLREQLQHNALDSGSPAAGTSPPQLHEAPAQLHSDRRLSELVGSSQRERDPDSHRSSFEHVAIELMRKNVRKRLEKKPSILNTVVCQELMGENEEGYEPLTPVLALQPRAAFASTRDTILQSAHQSRIETPGVRKVTSSTPKNGEEDVDGGIDYAPSQSHTQGVNPGIAGTIVRHFWFERVVIIVIVLNAIYIGVAADVMATKVYSQPPIELRMFEYTFLSIFILELALRFWVHGCNLFRRRFAEGKVNPNFYWNVLDCTVIVLQLIEIAPWGSNAASIDSISVIRILRVIRLVRIIRVIKIFRFVRDLRMIVYAIGKSLSLFFWAIVALALMNYTVSVMFTEMALSHRIRFNLDGVDSSEIERYFGSLPITMLSMFQAVTGGMDWGVLTDCFRTGDVDSSVVIFCLVAYVAFTQIALLNVITGVFLDTAMDSARDERDAYVVRNARVIFQAADHDQNGRITWPDFEKALAHPDVQNFFEAVDIHVSAAKGLFDLLDASGDGTISAEEFLNGCLRVRGPSKALDLLVLSRDMGMLFENYADVLDPNGNSARSSVRSSVRSDRDSTVSPRPRGQHAAAGTEAPAVKSAQHASDELAKAPPRRKSNEAPLDAQSKTSFSLIREMTAEAAKSQESTKMSKDPTTVLSFDALVPEAQRCGDAAGRGAGNGGKSPGEGHETLSLPGVCSYCGPS